MKLAQSKLGLLIWGCLFLFSCQTKPVDDKKQAETDEHLIKAFIDSAQIQASRHPSGIYYQVLQAGSGASIAPSSQVSVNYEGRLLNGQIFDKSEQAISFSLNEVIPGWTIGLPLVKAGGKIRLIIPSALAYGSQSPGAGIPANAVLDFTIELLHAD